MSLISCQSIRKQFGAQPLFAGVSLTISEGDRLGLIGPNGAGKSTLLQILAGVQTADDGTVAFRKNLRLGYVPQESRFEASQTPRSVVLDALSDAHLDAAEKDAQVNVVLGRALFSDFEVSAESLSGGWKKRLAIASALAGDPDVLLLDEPTNHLDLEGILWLERLLKGAPFASVVISHDRYFLENTANSVAEVNRVYPDGLFRARGSYSAFLLEREEVLHAQSKQKEALENLVRKEVEWLRRGPKARTTKSKARIDAAGRLMEDLADVQSRSVTGSAALDFSSSGRKTKKLMTAEKVGKKMGERWLFRDLQIALRPGMRLGLVGPNGSGKTTLLRLIAGQLPPDEGTVERADALRVVYFEQNRELPDPEMPLRRALCSHGDSVIYQDRPIHVAGWAKRFLFRGEQLDMPIHRLSGGEKARLLIARLMLEPADLLLMDEPTNDLDIPTLEVLEETLTEFSGALVLVTHDRFMLDRVSTEVLGLDGAGNAGNFADYSQWEASRTAVTKRGDGEREVAKDPRAGATAAPSKKRLSYNEQREWDGIEALIEVEEAKRQDAEDEVAAASLAGDPGRLKAAYGTLEKAQQQVDRLYERWGELGAKVG